jgi:hypothetical protein
MTDVHPTSLKEPTWRSNRLHSFAPEEQVGRNPTLDPKARTKNGVDSDSNQEDLVKEIARLQAKLLQLRLSKSAATRLQVTTESPLTTS